ncbi:HD domain-containing protein [Methanospirillum hungatei]|uniref:Cas10/Cmr2 second palm domain-containing protein n=1 Tax=Methanospirillum hungatei TaxID=2203 RepID=UPI0026F2958A|nr:HD domain-containing protein [Methanospirillum hungatei]MCA1917701.1 HD domain-containing protein [Methanospirillum hungatei]
MNERIGVMDWFTKVRSDITYGHESDGKTGLLIDEIASSFGSKSLSDAATRISKVLEQNDFLQSVCSDTRLPVCSLYHHLRNTAAIAVCLLVDKILDDDQFIRISLSEYGLTNDQLGQYRKEDLVALVRIGSLFHDLGKVRSFSSERKNVRFYEHVSLTEEIVREILSKVDPSFVSRFGLDAVLPLLARRHHAKEATTRLEKFIHAGDVVSSSADRQYEVSGEVKDGKLVIYSKDPVFPHEINCNDGDYACSVTPHTILLGYKQDKTVPVRPKNENEKYRILFKDSVVQGGPGEFLGDWSFPGGKIGYLSLDIMQIQDFIMEADKLPMLRGGSEIVSNVLQDIKKLIAEDLGDEAVLFSDGGNLLAFCPSNAAWLNRMKEKAEEKVTFASDGILRAAVTTGTIPLKNLAGSFYDFLKGIVNELNMIKQEPYSVSSIHPPKKDLICDACRNRLITGSLQIEGKTKNYCSVCAKKENFGRIQRDEARRGRTSRITPWPFTFIRENNLRYPHELTDIGDSIAVIAIDGNMMGRLFSHTLTPAEYTFKSEQFSRRFMGVVRESLEDLMAADQNKKDPRQRLLLYNPKPKENGESFSGTSCGFDIIYDGGDDLLIIMNAKAALLFCQDLITRVAKAFSFDKSLTNGSQYDTYHYHTVTISCGVAIADNKFPIYFLLDRARSMESKAKEAFRKKSTTDKLNLINLPAGAVAFIAVQGAMPSSDYACYVLPDDTNEMDMLMKIIHDGLDSDNRSGVRDLITCGDTALEKLNFIKYNYASALRKQQGVMERILAAGLMADIVNSAERGGHGRNIHGAIKMVVPLLWHAGGEE